MSGELGRLLLVDDDESLRFAIGRFLTQRGFEVIEAEGVSGATAQFLAHRPEIAIVDHGLPDGDGLQLVRTLRRHDPGLAAIMLTGMATIELAVQAIQDGAHHFLTKPVELEELERRVTQLAEARRAERVGRASRQGGGQAAVDPFVGDSAVVRKLRDDALRVAGAPVTVLIEGETGTGKGVLARWLHLNGPRRDEPWVDLNCAGLSRQLLETELFGHEKGAFTGAVTAKPGLLEVADRGTLFLDEIGDMSVDIQPRLLKVLEEKSFRRLGDVRQRRVDVRLIAATHHDLLARSRAGEFRSDLLYRINSVRLVVPPLRQRRADLVPLARSLVGRLAGELRCEVATLEPGAEAALLAYDWPGNVRELRNVLERTLLFGGVRSIGAAEIENAIGNGGGSSAGEDASYSLLEAEKRHIRSVLQQLAGDVRSAAQVLGISRSGLYKKLQRHGLSAQRS